MENLTEACINTVVDSSEYLKQLSVNAKEFIPITGNESKDGKNSTINSKDKVPADSEVKHSDTDDAYACSVDHFDENSILFQHSVRGMVFFQTMQLKSEADYGFDEGKHNHLMVYVGIKLNVKILDTCTRI